MIHLGGAIHNKILGLYNLQGVWLVTHVSPTVGPGFNSQSDVPVKGAVSSCFSTIPPNTVFTSKSRNLSRICVDFAFKEIP